jgi:phage terminase large subunit-like protein
MVNASLNEIDYRIKVLESRDDLIKFTELTMPDLTQEDRLATLYRPSNHHRLIAKALQDVEAGRILRLMIMMPPRSGKSEMVSKRFPAWFVGRKRTRQLILATYSAEFSGDFGRHVRDIISSEVYKEIFPGVDLRPETRSAARMEIVNGGLMVFAGVGGPVHGRGADCLVIDDPLKLRKEAESKTIRDAIWDWYTSTAFTRLMPGGRVVIIMQRWDEDDLIGRLLSTDYTPQRQIDKWTILKLPAIANENTNNEKALWPAAYPIEVLREIKDVVGPRDWNSLYQQRPTPPEGAFFRRDDIVKKCLYNICDLPKILTNYTAFDLAVSKEKRRDATCCGTGGLDENDTLWILPELYWEKKDADESVEYIGQHIINHDPVSIYCETGQLDKAVGPFLEKYLSEHKIYKYFEKFPNVGVNKGARATAIRGRIAQGKVKFPRDAYWWPMAFDQMLKFNGTGDNKEDDFVDMIALLGQGLHRQVYTGTATAVTDETYKVGTLAWVKQDSLFRERMSKAAHRNDGW